MAKFRRIPEEIEAVRLDPTGVHRSNLPAGIVQEGRMFFIAPDGHTHCHIDAGDWYIPESYDKRPDRGDGKAPKGYEPVVMELPSHIAAYLAGVIKGVWKTPREYLHNLIFVAQQPGTDQELVIEALRRVLTMAVENAPLEDLVSWARQLEDIVYDKGVTY